MEDAPDEHEAPPSESRTILGLFLNDIAKTPLLTKEQEIALATRIKAGDRSAVDALVEANLRLVVKIARDYERCGMDLLDLISEGSIGLMTAAERFDPKFGAKFSTYASIWIKQKIFRALQNHTWDVRVPVRAQEQIKLLRNAEDALCEELGRPPTDDEIRDKLVWPQRTLNRVQQTRQSLQYEQPDKSEDGDYRDVLEHMAAPEPEDEGIWLSRLNGISLPKLVMQMKPRDRFILTMRFGLNGSTPKTLEITANAIGLTRERTRQIEFKALRTLRELINAERVKVKNS